MLHSVLYVAKQAAAQASTWWCQQKPHPYRSYASLARTSINTLPLLAYLPSNLGMY